MAAAVATAEAEGALMNALRLASRAAGTGRYLRYGAYLDALKGIEAKYGFDVSRAVHSGALLESFVGNPAAYETAAGIEAGVAESKLATPLTGPRATIAQEFENIALRVRNRASLLRGGDLDVFDADMEFEQSVEDAISESGSRVMQALELAPEPGLFGRVMAKAGITVRAAKDALAIAMRNYSNRAEASQVFQRWLSNRIGPVLGAGVYGGAAGFILGQKPWEKNRADMSVFEKTQVGRWITDLDTYFTESLHSINQGKPEIDVAKITSKIIDREIMEAKDQLDKEGGTPGARGGLNGSVLNTPSPSLPFGPDDTMVPKSSPTYEAPPRSRTTLPPTDAFTSRYDGDALSERGSDPAARTLKSSIPSGPSVNYSADDFRVPAGPAASPWVSGVNKRKAELAIFDDSRRTERVISQNYDPTYTSSLPASVTPATSAEWKEYNPEFKSQTRPLTDAPNVVGIGFDEASTERQLAIKSLEQKPGEGADRNYHSVVAPSNQTNPAVKDSGKNPAPIESKRIISAASGGPAT